MGFQKPVPPFSRHEGGLRRGGGAVVEGILFVSSMLGSRSNFLQSSWVTTDKSLYLSGSQCLCL